MKISVILSGMGGKRGRYAKSIRGMVDARRAVGSTNDEIRAALLDLQAKLTAAAASPADDRISAESSGDAAVIGTGN